MYDELVKRLREIASIPEHCENVVDCDQCSKEDICLSFTNKRIVEVVTQAADAIEELQQQVEHYHGVMYYLSEAAKGYKAAVPKWIPVTERLPKKELGIYWICTDSGYQCECRWTNNRWGLGESDKWGWNIMDVPQYQKVIAWRELPEPYEPPKENNDGN